MRIFSNLSKIRSIKPIIDDLCKPYRDKPLMKHMLESSMPKSAGERYNNIYSAFLVPLEIQQKLEFMLSQIPEKIMFMYSKWLLDAAGVEFGTESESLLIDIVRYIVVNITPSNEIITSNILQRYTLIGHFITL